MGLVSGWRGFCPPSLARARRGHPSVKRRGPKQGSPVLDEAMSCPLNASTPAPPQSLLGKMVLYRSLEAWPGISRSSGLTKFEGILWRGRGRRCVSSGPLPGLPSPTSLVEGARSLLASGGRSEWGAGRGWSLLLPRAPGVLSPKGPRGQACQLLLIQKGSDSGALVLTRNSSSSCVGLGGRCCRACRLRGRPAVRRKCSVTSWGVRTEQMGSTAPRDRTSSIRATLEPRLQQRQRGRPQQSRLCRHR